MKGGVGSCPPAGTLHGEGLQLQSPQWPLSLPPSPTLVRLSSTQQLEPPSFNHIGLFHPCSEFCYSSPLPCEERPGFLLTPKASLLPCSRWGSSPSSWKGTSHTSGSLLPGPRGGGYQNFLGRWMEV